MLSIPQGLHFLRPEAFYAFIPLLLFVVLYLTSKASSRSWKSVCDDQLLPHILTTGTRKSSLLLPMLLIILASSISIFAMAGPVWKKLPQPVFREESALVIALDLSQSMQATDVKPSRLERAKLKVLDLIKARKGGQTALIVYAATAFTVTPLTDDDNTIANLIPSLEPDLMPAQGSNMASALELSAELLQQAGVGRGDVLVVTDGITDSASDAISQLTASGHRLSIMGVGTPDGSPIPLSGGFLTDASGAIVITRLEPSQLQQAALKGSGIFVSMQADDSDIERLATMFASKRVKTESDTTNLKADIWQEEGAWLLLLVIPLVALWPRRGWLLCLPLFLLPVPQPAYAADTEQRRWIDTEHLWLRPDQQAMRAFKAGDAEKAAELFDDSDWKAAAHYRAGDYASSNQLLESPDDSTGHYNKGNVLAKLGQYEDAIRAYDQALSMDPANEDARYNRDLVQKALQQQQQQQQQGSPQQNQQQDGSQSQSEQQQQPIDQQQESEQDAQQKQDDQQSKEQQQHDQSPHKQQGAEQQQDQLTDINEKKDEEDTEDEKENEQADMSQPQAEQQQQAETEMEAQQQDEAFEQEDAETVENEQAMQQWLRRIPDDPGGLMRRKFIYQYRQMPNQAESKEPW
ncbi:MAG: VWA domain-containing protein [Thiotrichales bacterium]|nr:MAG: VWA domain-containing protein [Thiotrichales bacterium]